MRLWLGNPLAIHAEQADNGVVIEGGRIVERVAAGQRPARPVDQVFDASAHVILPGLINTHHHFYQTLTRAVGAAIDKPLFPWLQTLYPIWAGLDAGQLTLATQLASVELMLSGCTTLCDHHYVFPPGLEEAIDIQADVLAGLGARGVLTRGSMSLGVEQGGLPPTRVVQSEADILADSERLIARYHDRKPGAMLQIALAPCSPFSVSAELMTETARLAEAEQVMLHTHLAETEDETRYCLQRTGLRPLDYLDSLGWVSERAWYAHGIHFTDEEIARMGRAGVKVTHCPSSNMALASGVCRTLELEAAGVQVGLGVDGSASNDASNLIQELRQAMLLQRLHYGAERVGHAEVLRWATRGSAACLGRDDIGEIREGKCADLALFRLDEPRFSGAQHPLAALLHCGATRVDRLMVNGEWVVEDARVNGLDLPDLLVRHNAAALRLVASL